METDHTVVIENSQQKKRRLITTGAPLAYWQQMIQVDKFHVSKATNRNYKHTHWMRLDSRFNLNIGIRQR